MSSHYLYERMMQQRVEEEHRQAASRRLQKLVRKGRRNWLARQRCRVLSWLGDALVQCGRKLLRLISQSAPSVQGAEDRGA
jgi:hypothetical protein